jgi:hypothetical protein
VKEARLPAQFKPFFRHQVFGWIDLAGPAPDQVNLAYPLHGWFLLSLAKLIDAVRR